MSERAANSSSEPKPAQSEIEGLLKDANDWVKEWPGGRDTALVMRLADALESLSQAPLGTHLPYPDVERLLKKARAVEDCSDTSELWLDIARIVPTVRDGAYDLERIDKIIATFWPLIDKLADALEGEAWAAASAEKRGDDLLRQLHEKAVSVSAQAPRPASLSETAKRWFAGRDFDGDSALLARLVIEASKTCVDADSAEDHARDWLTYFAALQFSNREIANEVSTDEGRNKTSAEPEPERPQGSALQNGIEAKCKAAEDWMRGWSDAAQVNPPSQVRELIDAARALAAERREA